MKLAAEPDRIGAVTHCAYELEKKKDGLLFSLQKDVELVCGFILPSLFCRLCLLSTGNSVYRADALPSTIPYHSLVNRLRFEVHVAVPYEALYANTKGGKDVGEYNAASRALILQLSNVGRQEQTERHAIIVLLHDTSMALSNEDTPWGYMYISRFILVMLLCLLSLIAARLIELRAVYLTVP